MVGINHFYNRDNKKNQVSPWHLLCRYGNENVRAFMDHLNHKIHWEYKSAIRPRRSHFLWREEHAHTQSYGGIVKERPFESPFKIVLHPFSLKLGELKLQIMIVNYFTQLIKAKTLEKSQPPTLNILKK